jgi:serine protease Do
VAEKLQKSGIIDRGWLGVQVRKITDDEATALALEKGDGLAVIKVTDGAPAAGAGLTAGDVITSFNGQPVRDIVAFAWAVANQPSSSDATLGIARKSGRSDLHLKLGRLPHTPPATSSTQLSSSGPRDDKGLTCLRFVPSVGMTVAVACEE